MAWRSYNCETKPELAKTANAAVRHPSAGHSSCSRDSVPGTSIGLAPLDSGLPQDLQALQQHTETRSALGLDIQLWPRSPTFVSTAVAKTQPARTANTVLQRLSARQESVPQTPIGLAPLNYCPPQDLAAKHANNLSALALNILLWPARESNFNLPKLQTDAILQHPSARQSSCSQESLPLILLRPARESNFEPAKTANKRHPATPIAC
ncbi:hypothetical protein PtA15_2A950 [Puccinia triticina]|uniref:Uncharacterized protein n=1 Tax=Puccinia triticina TaxID=208348 RepID=A0ABY7CE41_9BASI|nr:uncharacterized protein PtA15_2A950 [Puccinia triticina]WAQ82633.1 hypothetical protein PtA15_2A950 [Puccinia triticina]